MRYTAAQKRAYASKMAKKRKPYKSRTNTTAKVKFVRATAKAVVQRELNRRVENYMNASRLSQSGGFTPTTGQFGNAIYFAGNIGGAVPIAGSSFDPLNTIAARNLLTIGPAVAGVNNNYLGKEIFGKHFKSTLTLTLPSVKTLAVGGADYQTIPTNYEYRAIYCRVKHRPGAGPSQVGQSLAPLYSILQNEIGNKFGPLSPGTVCVPDQTGAQTFLNNDLMVQPINRTNWQILLEKRGRLSCGSSMTATSNNASVTPGQSRYPSEARIHFNHTIKKKIQLDLDNSPAVATAQSAIDYNSSIYLLVFLNPIGEPAAAEKNWNDKIQPYISLSQTFTFTDM